MKKRETLKKYGWLLTLALALMGLPTLVAAQGGAVVFVDKDRVASGDGSSWEQAKRTLTEGEALLTDGDSLWVADGTYSEAAAVTIDVPNVTVYGGFEGTETELAQRDVETYVSTVDGGASWRCFTISSTNVTLDGMTIARGRANGAGIYNTGAGLTLRNCTLDRCSAGFNAGVGGGIYSTQPMYVLDSTFVDNVAGRADVPNNNGAAGGIYFSSGGTLFVSNTVFRGNESRMDNSGTSWHGSGGAIFMASGGTLDARNCVFDSNRGYSHPNGGGGGAIYADGGSVTFEKCTFYGNHDKWYGGAIRAKGGVSLDLLNCIFWGNTDGTDVGRQIYLTDSGSEMTISYGCVPGTNTTDIYMPSGSPSLTGIVTSDPLFVSAETGDLHLQSAGGHWTSGDVFVSDAQTSPCIDAGAPTDAFANETLFNGGQINLGAYGNTAQASRTLGRISVFMAR